MSRFLHFIPTRDLANKYHGTYKDVVSRVQWLQNHVSEYRQIQVRDDDPAVVDASLADGGTVDAALIEYSHYPRILKRLKHLEPRAFVAVRAINIEPLQHLDNHGWRCDRGPLWMFYGMGRLLAHDLAVKQAADVILSINPWENRIYWGRLPGRARVEWLPYRCPDHLLPGQSLPYRERRIIACMPTSQKNRKSWDLVIRFQRLATEMKRRGSPYQFVVTGNLHNWNLPACDAVLLTGFVNELASFTGTCKAVALLSPLGYGFKTTIADALAAGAHVLAHPALVRHCPDLIKQHLICVDSQAAEPNSIMQRLSTPPSGAALHDELTNTADAVMERWLLRQKGYIDKL